MKLLSVNVGTAQEIEHALGPRPSGIDKRPTSGRAVVTLEGLRDDAVCNRQHHGGPDQAVYVYCQPDYDWWSTELGRTLRPGTFGENLTIDGLGSAEVYVGNRLAIGETVLEVTAPRVPCGTLAARMSDPEFVRRFRSAERPGFYCRVVQVGAVQADDRVTWEARSDGSVSVLELFRDHYRSDLDPATLRRQLAAPIASRYRIKKEAQLATQRGEPR